MKAATKALCEAADMLEISIHAAREGGDTVDLFGKTSERISIHAAREGGDGSARALPVRMDISIHAAREGGDRQAVRK